MSKIKDMRKSAKKDDLLARAQACGLDETATEKQVLKAEGREHEAPQAEPTSVGVKIKHMSVANEKENDERNKWIDRAKAVGLDARATQAEVEAAEGDK